MSAHCHVSALRCPALPHPALPCPASPCPVTAVPCPALPCPPLPHPALSVSPCPALICRALHCCHWPWQVSVHIEFQLVMQEIINHTCFASRAGFWPALPESFICSTASATLTLSSNLAIHAGWVSVCHAMGQQPHLLHEAKVFAGQTYPGPSAAAAV